MGNNSRRNFLKKAGLAAGSFYIVPRHVLGKGYTAPSDKLNIMGIGAGGKGQGDIMSSFNKGAENIVALANQTNALEFHTSARININSKMEFINKSMNEQLTTVATDSNEIINILELLENN